MKKLFITCILYSCTLGLTAQVGINTNSPTSTLHVDGDVIMDNALYLENPSASSKIRNSNLLISLQNSDIVEYDIDVSKYGPIIIPNLFSAICLLMAFRITTPRYP